MTENGGSHFGYRFRREDDGWRWMTFNPAGDVSAEGVAPSRAAAAARVIEALAGEALRTSPQL